MPLKIALTGATGFVGRAVVSALMAKSCQVSALLRDPARAEMNSNVRRVQGDLQNSAALDALTKGADAVIHIAGVIGALSRNDFFAANELGSLAVAEAAARNGVKRFVYISSLAAREAGLSMYGASKRAGEVAVEKFKTQMSVLVLRPPAVYGPGDKGTLPLLRSLTQSFAVIPGTSTSRFSLIYVDDLARIIVEAAEASRTGTVELDDGQRQGYCWKDLAQIASATEQKSITPIFLPKSVAMAVGVGAEAFAKLRGKLPFVSPDKIQQLYFSDWVARGEGWPLKEPVGFAQGFKSTVDWYRKAQWLPERFGTRKIVM
ncbi:MAG TPA: NAD-dependent epimerase/dehydratase family protein [Aestuariivirga sp.]|nr:NAD-dependent epimerase/dehydratase family protein [Aestuariivirga sp.]